MPLNLGSYETPRNPELDRKNWQHRNTIAKAKRFVNTVDPDFPGIPVQVCRHVTFCALFKDFIISIL